ncbi:MULTISPECIES: lactonase family protein [unclassified Streptomyces]|uniref:lactonase family protein n=1 Tax=unclassified Streptomyces TaxID=2593676 RepID=UPI002DD7DE95|nr:MULTISPECIES: lactonase family protein [unclassified Streptomyces]WSC57510.1 lactonase family protein [Streptomyces sp. NBC_01761]WSF88614.1 lactonase family protein [Streptomyces sp. NBC_01744]WSJ54851.1 lactonase family protein [Streptomyces sp. NBC_01318]
MSSNDAGRAFIGSFTSAGGRGVTVAAVDGETGALTVLGATDAVPDPSYLVLGPGPGSGSTALYAVSETESGAAAALDITGDVPQPLGEIRPVEGDGPTHLAIAGGHLITANYGSGSVTALPVRADGSLGAAASVLQHEGSGPRTDRQHAPHAHQVQPDPSGNWVLSVDLGTDSIRICALDPSSGTLRLHGETALRPGAGPRHLAFHPAGAHAYVLNELEPTVTVCRWDPATGVLEPVAETAVVPEDVVADPEAVVYPSAVVVSYDGRFLWAANRGHDSIAVLALDASGEKASLVTNVGCGGHWPRDLALDPTGQWLYAANERAGNVSWFAVDATTGIPCPRGSLTAPAASCVVFG